MKVVGLTGGIGSGKTTVAQFFKELGVPVYIADTEAKRIMNSSLEVRQKITSLFGANAYVRENLDRKYISSEVFADKAKLEALNKIVHPAVKKDFGFWKARQDAAYVIYETAILFEQGSNRHCDQTLLITADKDKRIERLLKRDQSSIDEIQARMSHQWSDEKKIALADFVIENKDLTDTYQKVKELHEMLLQTA